MHLHIILLSLQHFLLRRHFPEVLQNQDGKLASETNQPVRGASLLLEPSGVLCQTDERPQRPHVWRIQIYVQGQLRLQDLHALELFVQVCSRSNYGLLFLERVCELVHPANSLGLRSVQSDLPALQTANPQLQRSSNTYDLANYSLHRKLLPQHQGQHTIRG